VKKGRLKPRGWDRPDGRARNVGQKENGLEQEASPDSRGGVAANYGAAGKEGVCIFVRGWGKKTKRTGRGKGRRTIREAEIKYEG